jgi:hypothetical protein
MELPVEPGLARRQAYGQYVRQRNLNMSQMQLELDIAPAPITYEEEQNGLKLSDLMLLSKIILCPVNDICAICQDTVNQNVDIIRELNCKHFFHVCCIDRWFCMSATCPLCKKSLKIE